MQGLHWDYCDSCNVRRMEFVNKPCPRRTCAKFSQDFMDPGVVPPELERLSFVEAQLIARIHPVVSVYKIRGHQFGYRGNVINFPQEVNDLARALPHRIQDLSSIIAVRQQRADGHVDFRVRAGVVRQALLWLRDNNPYYANVEVSEGNLALLPEDGDAYQVVQGYAAQEEDPDDPDDPHDESSVDHVDVDDIAVSGVPMLQPHRQEDQVHAVLNYPTRGTDPVSEATAGYVVMAFPKLFPFGRADLYEARSHGISARQYFSHLLQHRSGRFADDARFRFFAFNTVMRHDALRAGNLYVRRNEHLQGKTVRQLREMVRECAVLAKNIMFYGTKLPATRQYWGARLSELLDMIDQIGLPTLFLTLSAADFHWPDLFRLFLACEGLSVEERVLLEELTEEHRRNFIANRPFVPSMFFMKRAELFLIKILKLMYPVTDIWFRYEWQFRGSPHVHCLIWLRGAPDMMRVKDMTPEELAAAVEYFSNIVSCFNFGQGLPPAVQHPCRIRLGDIPAEDRERALGELLNRVQRHKCTANYCLRKDKTGAIVCRFKFPFELAEENSIVFDDKGEAKFIGRRNDELINGFIIAVIEAWRANMDAKPVTSHDGCVNYLAKYTAKPENKSKTMQELFEDALSGLQEEDSAKKAIQRRCIQSVSERDYSSQEILHLATSQKLFRSSRAFVKIVFTDRNWVPVGHSAQNEDVADDVEADDPDSPNEDADYDQDGELVLEEELPRGSILDKYPKRPANLENITLWEFAREFQFNRQTRRWYRRRKVAVVCVFPRLRLTGNEIRDEGFYRQQVLLHVPWRDEDAVLGEHANWHEVYAQHDIVPRGGQPAPQVNEDDELEDLDFPEAEPDEEWMVIARQHPNQDVQRIEIGRREMDLAHDWAADAATYGDVGQLMHAVELSKDHHEFEAETAVAPDVQLTVEQSAVIRILDRQIAAAQGAGGPPPPMRVIVQGKAGCGKSTVIAVMKSRIVAAFGPRSFLLVAPTGAAADNIDGETIHSALLLTVPMSAFAPLTGERAKMFQESMEPVRFLIVDEYSMIGLPILGMMERRCAEGKPGSSETFGGLYVYLIGDLAQLPPVRMKPIFSNTGSTAMELNGRRAFQDFRHAVVLRESQRQSDPSFRAALDELGLGKCSAEAFERYRQRFSHRVPPAEQRLFRDALHIFPINKGAAAYNVSRLERLGRPVARIPARHNNATAAAAPTATAGGLSATLHLSVGSRVMLRANLWTRAGLVNGASGTVAGIVYSEGSRPPDVAPAVIMVKFDRYSGPALAADGSVPICTIMRSWKEGQTMCTREQFPLNLAWGCTVHAAQGLSVDRVVVDIGNQEFSAGLAYVALSRCREWSGLLIENAFVQDRLDKLQKRPSVQKKADVIARIERLARATQRLIDAMDQGSALPPQGTPSPPPRPLPPPPPPARGRGGRRPSSQPPDSGPSKRGRGAPRGRAGRGARGQPSRRPPALPVDVGVQVHGGTVTAARIGGDGHCLFNSLLHQLNGSIQYGPAHDAQIAALRQRVVQHIRAQLVGPEAANWIEILRTTVNGLLHRYPQYDEDGQEVGRQRDHAGRRRDGASQRDHALRSCGEKIHSEERSNATGPLLRSQCA
ncbi:uncharacterized protein LOC117640409 [Thrips palmi]|uniref:ATP-dependent DNA helicase n=1 Tax=Thrips palmi TaxID=161013 RepID=A0A6P8Y842_THRPL|nr:uncharacterized protein LOC117640409 [Thrips palmi]